MNHTTCHKGLAGIAIAVILAMTILAGCGAPANRPAFAIHTIDADDQALHMAADAGTTTIVQLFEWRLIELQPGEYNWEYPDFVVRACDYYGLQLVMRLDHPPEWAIEANADPALPADLDAFAAFAGRVAARYRGSVLGYVIWNEPNLSREWNGQAPNPAGYARLLARAHAAIKAADPQAIVAGAGLAPTNQNDAEAMNDLVYLSQMLEALEGRPFDVLAIHPYAFGLAPDAPADANDGLNARRITRLQQVLADAGLGDTPLWITEMGWTTSGPAEASQKAVTPAQQARYLVQSFELAEEKWPRVESLAVWNLSTGLAADDEKAGYSIVDSAYNPLPAYAALAERFGQPSPRAGVARWWKALNRASGPIQILSPDVAIRLGDSDTFHPHWSRIYDGRAPSREWAGVFYVENRGQGEWELSMEIMQVQEQGNLIYVNGQALDPPAIPLRGQPDYTSVWTSVTMRVPAGLLKRGVNEIRIQASPRLPAQQFVRYESLQFRNLQLTRL